MIAGAVLGAGLGVFALLWWLRAPATELPPAIAITAPKPTVTAPKEAETVVVDAGAAARSASLRPTTARAPATKRTPLGELTRTDEWPSEPESPSTVEDAPFIAALELLCGPYADKSVAPWYGPWLLRSAREHGADPFLLGALMFSMSGCTSDPPRIGSGLTGLDPSLYEHDVSKGRYRFRAFENGLWTERTIKIKRFPFNADFVRSAESNLYFAAAFLPAWQQQVNGLRASFVQPSEYRHYVSHFVWGDQVRSHREEDAILVERRRLLQYYGAIQMVPPVRWHGFELGCPLDGCPRLVTSTLGDAREGGVRLHAGNDFESTRGEPVRAVADGLVVFAGVDLPGKGAASKIPIWAQRNVDPETMGAGGLYVCIDHGESVKGEKLVSCYMHLEAATVVQGRELKRGEQVGRVGTSGIKQSKPHLHFELHSSKGVHRATDLLKGLAVGHPTAHSAQQGAQSRHAFAPDAPGAARAREAAR